MSVIVYYHAKCPDGLTAAAVTRHALFMRQNIPNDEVLCLPIQYGKLVSIPDELPSVLERIYFVDYCPDHEQLSTVMQRLGNDIPIIILDHHISRKETGETLARDHANIAFVFDNNQSGASLCARQFQSSSAHTVLASVIQDVRDIDLWHWKRPDSYGMSILIGQKNSVDFTEALLDQATYEAYLPTARALSDFHRDLALSQGKSSMLAKVKLIDGDTLLWESHGMIPVLATDGMTSSLAVNRAIDYHQMDTQADIGIGFYTSMNKETHQAIIKLSVRGNGEHSTLAVTQPLGGGGHYNASGAKASRVEILADQNLVIFHA